jgi:hypothetical protein
MFAWLSKFDKIFVTGAQRSGTRICAKMIAHDTQFEFVDETQINMDSFYNFSSFLGSNRKYVIQCPTLCRYIHFFASEDSAVVLMRRNIDDIINSQKRIKWSKEWLERIRYDQSQGIISEIKYDFWEKFQKNKIANAFEIEYSSLKTHPLWIDKKERRNFSPMQIANITPGDSIPKNALLKKAPEAELFLNKTRTEGILTNENNFFHLINKPSLQIWEMCDGRHSKKEILDHLQQSFPDITRKTLAMDMDRFVEDLFKNHFITFSPRT